MRKWDVDSLKLLRDYPSSLAVDIRSLAFSPDGSRIFAGLSNGTILLWSDTDLTLREVDQAEYPGSMTTRFRADSPDTTAQPWITGTSGAAARLTENGVEVRAHSNSFVLPESPPRATQLAISPDGRFVAASSEECGAASRRLWDISGATPRVVPLPGQDDDCMFALAFRPPGEMLATAQFSGLYLWDAANGKLAGENVEPHRAAAVDLAFSPDGSRIALVLNGGEVLLVDTATQRVLGTHVFAGTEDLVNKPSTVAFSQDGRSLFIRKGDGKVMKWDADPKDWAARACRVAGRNLSLDEWKRYIGDTIPYHRTCPQFPDGEGVAK
jgi:WD40 repeat protein